MIAIINTPAPVSSQPSNTPAGLAASASERGSIKMPDPTILPTTSAVNNQNPSCCCFMFVILSFMIMATQAGGGLLSYEK